MTTDAQANSTIERFLVTLVINAVIGGLIFLVWVIIRTFLPSFYHPRGREEGVPRYSRIPFMWLWDAYKLSDKQLFISHGPDVVLYLRIVRFMLLVCLAMFIPMCALFPIHATGSNKDLPDDDPKKDERS